MAKYPGQQQPSTPTSEYSAQRFHIQRMLSRVSTATLVKVEKCTNKGEVKKVGTVDVTPMINLQDGTNKQFKHVQAYNLPYFRLQGGSDKAVIMDPKPGDWGVAVFADRDISTAKKTKKQGPPGSKRRFSMADGMFFPCFLGDKPTCYVQFTDDGKIVASPDDGKTQFIVEKNKISMKVQNPNTAVYLTPGRVDLGKLNAPHAVSTVDGPSTKVFAVIDEVDS